MYFTVSIQYEIFNKELKETIGIKVKREKETKIKKLQVNIYEIDVNFFHISHKLICYCETIVHKFTRIYPVCLTYELTKQFG